VAIKVMRKDKKLVGYGEIKMLKFICGSDPEKKSHCVRLLHDFECRGHLCLVFEQQQKNIRELLEERRKEGGNVPLPEVQEYGRQILRALAYLSKLRVVHNDMKLDNMLLSVKKSRWAGGKSKISVTLCDFGAASIAENNKAKLDSPYIMARLYRPPELILGHSHGVAVDVWGFACCMFELYTGHFLFPGVNNNGMLRKIQEVCGHIPKDMLRESQFCERHFDAEFRFLDHSKGDEAKGMAMDFPPKPNNLLAVLCPKARRLDMPREELTLLTKFRDVLQTMLMLRPASRMAAATALKQAFFLEPEKSKGETKITKIV